MSRVITFRRTFPAYHPKAGEQTMFIQKFWKSFYIEGEGTPEEFHPYVDATLGLTGELPGNSYEEKQAFWKALQPKYHTIRAGHRWKVGDWFSPRVWSGKPYNSKQIQFAPDIQIKKVWDFKTDGCDFFVNDLLVAYASSPSELFLSDLASNDGLSERDLLDWFEYPQEFHGQIICWNESINY